MGFLRCFERITLYSIYPPVHTLPKDGTGSIVIHRSFDWCKDTAKASLDSYLAPIQHSEFETNTQYRRYDKATSKSATVFVVSTHVTTYDRI